MAKNFSSLGEFDMLTSGFSLENNDLGALDVDPLTGSPLRRHNAVSDFASKAFSQATSNQQANLRSLESISSFEQQNPLLSSPETNFVRSSFALAAFDITAVGHITGGDPNGSLPSTVDANQRRVRLNVIKQDQYSNKSTWQRRDTWIIIHGWNSNSDNFQRLGEIVKNVKPNDIVLTLDWREAANVGGVDTGGNFRAASWIHSVAEFVHQKLLQWGIGQSDAQNYLHLIGHSLGTYVASEIASLFTGGAKEIIALDPASETRASAAGYVKPEYKEVLDLYTNGYDLNFSNGTSDPSDKPKKYIDVSKFSRAFVGARSVAGNQEFASYATESFQINFGSGIDVGAEHGLVIKAFEELINTDKATNLNPQSLAEKLLTLDDSKIHTGFIQNAYEGRHEGIIYVTPPRAFETNPVPPLQINYLVAQKQGSTPTSTLVYGTIKNDELKALELIAPLPPSPGTPTLKRNAIYYGDEGNDTINSGNGDDTLYGGLGNDVLSDGGEIGTSGKDELYGN